MKCSSISPTYLPVCLYQPNLPARVSLSAQPTCPCVSISPTYLPVCLYQPNLPARVSLSAQPTCPCVSNSPTYLPVCLYQPNLPTRVSLSAQPTYPCVSISPTYLPVCLYQPNLPTRVSLSAQPTYPCVSISPTYLPVCLYQPNHNLPARESVDAVVCPVEAAPVVLGRLSAEGGRSRDPIVVHTLGGPCITDRLVHKVRARTIRVARMDGPCPHTCLRPGIHSVIIRVTIVDVSISPLGHLVVIWR